MQVLLKPSQVFLIVAIFSLGTWAQNAAESRQAELSKAEKSKIVKMVFDSGFGQLMNDGTFGLCTTPIVNDEKIILVKTDDGSIFPKKFGEYRFKFLTHSQIESEIKSNDGDCYIDLSPFQIKRRDYLTITLWRWVAVVTVVNGRSRYPARWVSAVGLRYRAIKVHRRWILQFDGKTGVVS
jgi:hypothetical protein